MRGWRMRARLMQHSLDATVLALSSEAAKLSALPNLDTRAVQIFNVNFPSGKAEWIT